MKFAIEMQYNTIMVFDPVTFSQITPLLAKGSMRTRKGYSSDALYAPSKDQPHVIVLNDEQVVDSFPEEEPQS